MQTRQRARRDKALALVERCREAQAQGDVVGLSAVTVSELEFGATTTAATMTPRCSPFGRSSLPLKCSITMARPALRITAASGMSWNSSGQAIGAMDLLIAAHSLALAATLVTNNLAHFQRVSGLSADSLALTGQVAAKERDQSEAVECASYPEFT